MSIVRKVNSVGTIYYHNGNIYYTNEHGYLHREDGPAAIWEDGTEYYYLNNEKYSYEDWLDRVTNPIMIKWREYCENRL